MRAALLLSASLALVSTSCSNRDRPRGTGGADVDTSGDTEAAGGDANGAGGGDTYTGGDSQSAPPAGWACDASLYADGACDCGCGTTDPDCGGAGCTSPGPCSNSACEHCYNAQQGSIQCIPPPSGWTCAAGLYGDGACHCGCTAVDRDCFGAGCTTPGPCSDAACDACYDSQGATPCVPPPADWACLSYAYGDGSCDCGCVAADPDCAGVGCTTPGECSDAACVACYDVQAHLIPCTPVPGAWTCDPFYYSDPDCDCGCGALDPACGGGGCATPGPCADAACDFCYDATSLVACGG